MRGVAAEQSSPELNQSLPFFIPSTLADWNEPPLPSKRKPGSFLAIPAGAAIGQFSGARSAFWQCKPTAARILHAVLT